MSYAVCHCGREWTGTSQAHCSVCHAHFSTVANFDRHGPNLRGCPDPASLTRTKKDGTEVPVLKAVEQRHGLTWVSFSEDPRFAEEAEQ